MVDPRYDEPRLRLGVSACLLGKPVRFDGGHKRDTFLGTPREAMRLVHQGGTVPMLPVEEV